MSELGQRAVIIAGHVSSGKTTLASNLAAAFGVPFIDGGDALKELATDQGYAVSESKDWWDTPEGIRFLEQRQTDPQFDHKVDAIMKRHAERGDCVLTSWTLPWIHQSDNLHVWLDTPTEERIRRISARDAISLDEARAVLEARDRKNRDHYFALYGIRFGTDLGPFHLVVNGMPHPEHLTAETAAQIRDVLRSREEFVRKPS